MNQIKPGTDNQKTGDYIEVGPQGELIESAREITIQAGDRLPPTSKKGNTWKRKDNNKKNNL